MAIKELPKPKLYWTCENTARALIILETPTLGHIYKCTCRYPHSRFNNSKQHLPLLVSPHVDLQISCIYNCILLNYQLQYIWSYKWVHGIV